MSTTIVGTIKQTGTSSSTGTTPSPSTTSIPPTTNPMQYCTEQLGMNRPYDIPQSAFENINPQLDTTQLSTSDINPTLDKPGFTLDRMNPTINIQLPQDATITNIYIPIDKPSNVEQFQVQFFYPNHTDSPIFTSQIPSASQTTSSSLPSATSTKPSPIDRLLPSDKSPQILDLPQNFQVPKDTTVLITITKTADNNELPPTNVCIILFLQLISRSRFSMNCF